MSESASPRRECDLVMKGGVTSGVIYPAALLELSKHYRFRAVGGASAGAIAAAAAALAEYGRQKAVPGERAGFAGLKQLQEEMSKVGFFASRFRPVPPRRRLYEALLALKAAAAGKGLGGLLGGLGRALGPIFPGSRVLGAALGALAVGALAAGWALAAAPGLLVWLAVTVLLALALAGAWVGGLAGVLVALKGEVEQLAGSVSLGFGLCTGSAGEKASLQGAEGLELTDWLHVRLNGLMGRGPLEAPPTFKELADAEVELRMVACNLTLGQPYLLPMERGSRSFLFRREDFLPLFPPPVVDALVRWSDATPSGWFKAPPGFHRLPMGEEMPVILATRLSLAFPVLLSAVRIFAVKKSFYDGFGGKPPPAPVQLEEEQLEAHWMSDGGIASNFPIHVFDQWVPHRPTFGITLYDSPVPSVLRQRQLTDLVVLPLPADADKARPQRMEISSLLGLLRAVFDTAQSHRDNAQSALPSYRERIVQVFLQPGEGGLNLEMAPATIEALGQRGTEAARKLVKHFVRGEGTSFDEHLWVRLQVLMARLEDELFSVAEQVQSPAWRGRLRADFEGLLERQLEARKAGAPWYRDHSERWCQSAGERFEAVLELIERWKTLQAQWKKATPEGDAAPGADSSRFFASRPPTPQAMLRIHPTI